MDELPPYIFFQTENPVIRAVVAELLQPGPFRDELDGIFGPPNDSTPAFALYIGDMGNLEQMNRNRPRNQRAQIDPNIGAGTVFSAKSGPVSMGGIYIDADKLHAVTQQDSAKARELVRDAILHELSHAAPVARARHTRARTGDPDPRRGWMEVAQHPVMVGEAELRKLLGLQPRKTYGLLDEGLR